jgi:hypothetical protein
VSGAGNQWPKFILKPEKFAPRSTRFTLSRLAGGVLPVGISRGAVDDGIHGTVFCGDSLGTGRRCARGRGAVRAGLCLPSGTTMSGGTSRGRRGQHAPCGATRRLLSAVYCSIDGMRGHGYNSTH